MSEADQFRQYAGEAMSWAIQSKTEKEKATLLELARTWMRAATASDPPPMGVTTVRQTTIQLGRPPQLARSQTIPRRGL
jgi:hypothetical protein